MRSFLLGRPPLLLLRAMVAQLLLVVGAQAQTRVACIGNSITAAYGYTDSLRKLLGPGYAVENDGTSSTTAIRKGSYPYWTKGKLASVFAYKPDIVTIKLGTNDSKPNFWSLYSGQFKKDYLALIDTLGTMPTKPRIWIVLPVPTWRTEVDRPNDANLLQIIPILKQIAIERNLPVIDARTPLLNRKECFQSDLIHPKSCGDDSIAHAIWRALKASTEVDRHLSRAAPMVQLEGREMSVV